MCVKEVISVIIFTSINPLKIKISSGVPEVAQSVRRLT